ncbi:phage tail protein [Streptomyces sp. NBC_01381]|uniref:phage tail protein n=1 Tax=Streptomyces sp. NBC_01381 TaxID=2903845 RepID=UPI0022528BF3|nr:phage tail protein [Streptomyces sp. NBC_01381]MCX4673191.1 phage tail protein [Streptomyces sp. NBC_01381]
MTERALEFFTEPLPKFRFLVVLGPAAAYLPPAQAALLSLTAQGAFQQVAGLGAQLEVTAYPEGGVNDRVRQFPVRHSWNRIVLHRGVARGPSLWAWYQAGLSNPLGARRSGAVLLMDAAGLPGAVWAFRGGLASKWTGPDLHAERNEVAVEQLEIAHEGLVSVEQAVAALG